MSNETHSLTIVIGGYGLLAGLHAIMRVFGSRVTVGVIDDFSCELNIVVLLPSQFLFRIKILMEGILTANSPTSASSIPRISFSSVARRLRPGIKFIMKRMMQVPPKE